MLACQLFCMRSNAQDTVNLEARDMPFKKALHIIEVQTGYVLFMKDSLWHTRPPVNLTLHMAAAKAIESFLHAEGLDAIITGKSIMAYQRGKKPPADIQNATHSPMISNLDEVQVIAYGTTTRRITTGNVSVVTDKDIEQQPLDNPLLAIEGMVSGLFEKQASGLSNSGVTARAQGQNSISNGNDPLYVINGVPYSGESLATMIGTILGNSGGQAGTHGSPMAFVNPDDIESITVLKDADATAIYGSRAANGAILITTKKGKAGRTRLTLNYQQGAGGIQREWPLLNLPEYLNMRHEAIKNDGAATGPADYDLNGIWDTARHTDWQKKLIGGPAEYSSAYAAVSGGDKQTQYLFAGTYRHQTAVFPGPFGDEKGSGYLNLNTMSQDRRFRIQATTSYLIDNNRLPQADLTLLATTLAPDAPPLFTSSGQLNWQPAPGRSATWQNPLAYWYKTYNEHAKNLLTNAVFDYRLPLGLDAKVSVGYSDLNISEASLNALESVPPALQLAAGPKNRNGLYSVNDIGFWIVEPQLSFHPQRMPGDFTALVGGTLEQETDNGIVYSGSNFASDALLADMHSAASLITTSSLQSIYRYSGVFGRVTYAYKNRYLLNLTGRHDGSSRFGPANRFHDFASIGAGWIFSREQYIRDNFRFLSFGKIRGSYGTTGSDQISDYRYLPLFSPANVGNLYQGVQALSQTSIPNDNLQWEETKKLQVGADLGFLCDRIVLQEDYVRNRSSNELINVSVPVTMGAQTYALNIPAIVQNTALEMEVTTIEVQKKNFSWKTVINLTVPENKVVRYHAQANLPITVIPGKALGITRLFEAKGVDPATGVYQFAGGHGSLTSNPSRDTDLLANVNTVFPLVYGGATNSLRYKAWQLDIFLMYVKANAMNGALGQESTPGSPYTNQPLSVLHRWQKEGDLTKIQRFNSNYALNQVFTYAQSSSAAYSGASYLRIRNVALSWNADSTLLRKLGIKQLQIFVHGENLLTFTRFRGLDPETGSQVLPPLRMLTVGAHLQL